MSGIPIFRFAVSTLLQDTEEAAKAIELARGLREECPPGLKLEVVFFSHGSSFDHKIINDGFEVYRVSPELPGIGSAYDLKSTDTDMVGEEPVAYRLLKGEMEALREVRPDVFLHGFWPIAAAAAKLVPTSFEISYLPLPFGMEPFQTLLLGGAPEPAESDAPVAKGFRRFFQSKIPNKKELKTPFRKQGNILRAYARAAGMPGMPDLPDLLKSDFTVVHDFPTFYEGEPIPGNTRIVGPLYPPSEPFEEIDIKILQRFVPENGHLKIFCSLGSSGGRQGLMEAVRALSRHPEWESIVLCPRSVCPLEEVRAAAGGNSHVYLLEELASARKVMAMADLGVSDGEQGTVQAAIACGTPLVGLSLQPEQQAVLEHLVQRHTAIRLSAPEWNAENIEHAIAEISISPEYRQNMVELQEMQKEIDGKKNAAVAIWEAIKQKNILKSGDDPLFDTTLPNPGVASEENRDSPQEKGPGIQL